MTLYGRTNNLQATATGRGGTEVRASTVVERALTRRHRYAGPPFEMQHPRAVPPCTLAPLTSHALAALAKGPRPQTIAGAARPERAADPLRLFRTLHVCRRRLPKRRRFRLPAPH